MEENQLFRKYKNMPGLSKITLDDGFTFYEQPNGVFTDAKNGIDYDMYFDNFDCLFENTQNNHLSPNIWKIESY